MRLSICSSPEAVALLVGDQGRHLCFGTLCTLVEMAWQSASEETSRRAVLKGVVAGTVGVAAWQTPDVVSVDLRGARALAAASGPLVAEVTVTSNTRTRGGATFQHWGPSGSGASTDYAVPFAVGDVEVRVRRRATDRSTTQASNGTWLLRVNTVPPGCTACEVTNIVLTCPSGTGLANGVPGTSGDLRCTGTDTPETDAVTATFTVTCT